MSETSTGKTGCESCSMPIESGAYCQHCTDADGKLQPFAERFERMVQWTTSRNPETGRLEAEKQTLAYMATLPAWKDHPELLARLEGVE